MAYTFWFETRKDASYFDERAFEIATEYGMVRLSDLYDLKGEPSDYLANKVVWSRDSVAFDVHYERYDNGGYRIVFPEPDQRPASDKKSLSKVNGDIYFNPLFGDLWIVDDDRFIKINDGYDIPLDEPNNFIKVGHVDWAAIRDVSNGE